MLRVDLLFEGWCCSARKADRRARLRRKAAPEEAVWQAELPGHVRFGTEKSYFLNAGAYFAARRIASIMLTGLTLPVPAMSNAVP